MLWKNIYTFIGFLSRYLHNPVFVFTALQPNVFNIDLNINDFSILAHLQHSSVVLRTVNKAEEKAVFYLIL
ncbi:hypothetical protein [Prevotella falsenii]|uniref:hypothetical protein n=1 Tax=Prevotella falsenii TaxID=515414 RepID=UPI000469BF9D|nr:hypothetical protein [Prevotella falsenii]